MSRATCRANGRISTVARGVASVEQQCSAQHIYKVGVLLFFRLLSFPYPLTLQAFVPFFLFALPPLLPVLWFKSRRWCMIYSSIVEEAFLCHAQHGRHQKHAVGV